VDVGHELGDIAPVLTLARSDGLSAYDAAHFDLAVRLGLPLATLDEALKRAAQGARMPLI
jgi:predicted nucleic acid-binding protein